MLKVSIDKNNHNVFFTNLHNCWECYTCFREEELSHNVELTADLINPEVDLKFFPAAPVDKDVTNRVGISILNTAEDEP